MKALLAVIAIALLVGGVGGFFIGRHGTVTVRALTGTAHVGNHQMWVSVDGWQYGVSQSVPVWIDSSGTTHDDESWPACLRPVGGHVRIRFGAVPVTTPTGLGQRQVVWVDCSG